MTEPEDLATSPGMTHRNGRVLVARGPGLWYNGLIRKQDWGGHGGWAP